MNLIILKGLISYRVFSNYGYECIFTCRFGVCEPYNGNTEVCNDLLAPYVDYVFIPVAYETQNKIGSILESNLPNLTNVKTEDYCHDQIYSIMCNYYFIPCGNLTNTLPPSSICPEECSLIEESCPLIWEVVKLAMDSELPFIDCTDTGLPLVPLPHCCTGAGITQQLSETDNTGISDSIVYETLKKLSNRLYHS